MTDKQIIKYLEENNFEVDAQDCLMKVLNTSYQIVDRYYNFNTGMMSITTPDNIFAFKWNLKKI